jgi:hypothetical protein
MPKTMLDRIRYHFNKQSESPFSIGYITALEDSKRVRSKLHKEYYPKQIKSLSSQKYLKKDDKEQLSFAKGYRAFNSDLDK